MHASHASASVSNKPPSSTKLRMLSRKPATVYDKYVWLAQQRGLQARGAHSVAISQGRRQLVRRSVAIRLEEALHLAQVAGHVLRVRRQESCPPRHQPRGIHHTEVEHRERLGELAQSLLKLVQCLGDKWRARATKRHLLPPDRQLLQS
jgi:hypothetical protein